MNRHINLFDKIGSLIPGYKGYAEREGRRNVDKLLRETIADELTGIEKILYKRITDAFKANQKEEAKSIDEVRKQINTFISRVKYAPYGVTGFFADNQLKEDELLEIYKMDLELAEAVNKLKTNAASVNTGEILGQIDLCANMLDKRNQFINQFK